MAKITNLLHEFQDLFSTKFFEMKGILGDLGEMENPTEGRCEVYEAATVSPKPAIQIESEG